MRRRREWTHFVMTGVVLQRLLLERLAIGTQQDADGPIHGADDKWAAGCRAGHPVSRQQRTQNHRDKRQMDGCKAKIAHHAAKFGPRPAQINSPG